MHYDKTPTKGSRMPHVTRLRVISAAVAAGALTLGGFAMATAARRPGTQAVSAGTVSARIYLAGQDEAGLTAYATSVSTPGNALYGHYLTPAQVRARFGPTIGQIDAIQAWVRSAGLKVTGADSQLGGYVSVSGSVQARSEERR